MLHAISFNNIDFRGRGGREVSSKNIGLDQSSSKFWPQSYVDMVLFDWKIEIILTLSFSMYLRIKSRLSKILSTICKDW